MNGLIQSGKQLKKLEEEEIIREKLDAKFMRLALKEAEKAYFKGEVPVGAVIVKDGKVIARAYNQKEQKDCAVFHAEVLAVMKASKKLGWRLDGCVMYVTSEPCLMCAGAIVSSRISRLVYGISEDKSGFFEGNAYLKEIYEKSGLNHKLKVKGGVLEQECRKLWNGFFESKRD